MSILRCALLTGLVVALILSIGSAASASCGLFVSTPGLVQQVSNPASTVVLMREGRRTIQTIQNTYEGPPEDFAMVVPVPVVLRQEDVKTLPHGAFGDLLGLSAPSLVELREHHPCVINGPPSGTLSAGEAHAPGVKVEARFAVGEYRITILSSEDAAALERWLGEAGYHLPRGAEPVLRSYIAQGMYFFVARVDVGKVRFVDGRARLSPLRFHYDADTFSLPIRLGLLNAPAHSPQDLLVLILAGDRYEVANRPNVTIPTNLDLTPDVLGRFNAFYDALLDQTLLKHPGAAVTEYAAPVPACPSCRFPTRFTSTLLTLGADTLPPKHSRQLVLTRLHLRATPDLARDDLVFRAAPPIQGGHETSTRSSPEPALLPPPLAQNALPSPWNSFRARYAIRRVWSKDLRCRRPIRGRWRELNAEGAATSRTRAAQNAADPAPLHLRDVLRSDIDALGIQAPLTTHFMLSLPPPPARPSTPSYGAPDEPPYPERRPRPVPPHR